MAQLVNEWYRVPKWYVVVAAGFGEGGRFFAAGVACPKPPLRALREMCPDGNVGDAGDT